jgi:hypothetical protein
MKNTHETEDATVPAADVADRYKSNRLVVRVWTSSGNTLRPGGGDSVGHISLETPSFSSPAEEVFPGRYMSLWPAPFTPAEKARHRGMDAKGQALSRYFMERDLHLMKGCDYDVSAEGRAPEVVVCLYTLFLPSLIQKFDQYKRESEESKDKKSWRLVGDFLQLVQLDPEQGRLKSTLCGGSSSSHSCASLAYDLLKAGNLNEEALTSRSLLPSTPDDLAELAIVYKQHELARHPELKQIFVGDDTVPAEEPSPPSKKCSMM